QRMRCPSLQELAVGQWAAAAADRGAQDLARGVALADLQRKRLARRLQAETVLRVHGNERRDIELLAAALGQRAIVLAGRSRQGIGVPAAEGVVDLVDDRREPALGIAAEPKAQRIENIP